MENLIVYQKTYDMIQYGYQALKQFPRSEKYTLAAKELHDHYNDGKVEIEDIFFSFIGGFTLFSFDW